MPTNIAIPIPEQCDLWRKEDLSSADLAGQKLEKLHTYEDDSHLIRRLVRCRSCGQLYFYEFYEEIDWAAGEDPQYRTYIPVASENDAAALAQKSSSEILAFVPRLQSDFPKDAKGPTVRWIRN